MNNFCVIPWVSITSDNAGLVRPCCKFAEKGKQNEYPTGSLKENTYEEIWNGKDFQKIRILFFVVTSSRIGVILNTINTT